MQDESSLAGHVGERAPRSAEDAPDGDAKGPAQQSPEEPEEQFQEVESSSSQDEEDQEDPSRSSSQTAVPEDAEPPNPTGGTGSASGLTNSDSRGPASGLPESQSGRSSDARQSNGGNAGDGGSLGDRRGSGNEPNGGAKSALDAFLEGGLDVLATRRPSAKLDRFERYNLEAAVPSGGGAYGGPGAEDQDTEEVPGNAAGTTARLRHLTARQRKLMKQVCRCVDVHACMHAFVRAFVCVSVSARMCVCELVWRCFTSRRF